VIKALMERVSPRTFRVKIFAASEIVIFDRSWYNRAGVERVVGFCDDKQLEYFFSAVPGIEKAMIDSGIILLKYWLEVSPDEQTRRLESRIDDGRKIWKLSGMDLKSYTCWDDYTRARDDRFLRTDTPLAPWRVAKSDDKKRARLNIITHLLARIPCEEIKRDKVKLPKRKIDDSYVADYPFKFIPEVF